MIRVFVREKGTSNFNVPSRFYRPIKINGILDTTGTFVIIANAASIATRNGIAFRTVSPNLHLAILVAVYKQTPTGGMVEMQKYEEFSVQIAGDFYELLVIADVAPGIEKKIEALLPDAEFFQSDQKNGQILYNWKLSYVKEYRLGEFGEGDTGVTIVTFK